MFDGKFSPFCCRIELIKLNARSCAFQAAEVDEVLVKLLTEEAAVNVVDVEVQDKAELF